MGMLRFVHGVLPLSICTLQCESRSAQHPVANIDRGVSVNLFTIDSSGGTFNMCHVLNIYAVTTICVFQEVVWWIKEPGLLQHMPISWCTCEMVLRLHDSRMCNSRGWR